MKLELFNFVDETIELLDDKEEVLEQVSDELENFFDDRFKDEDHFLNIHTRIKSKDSLREKILRRNLYIKDGKPEKVLENLSDLIGVRIECRFIEDEIKIYREIKRLFDINEGDGYYSNKINPSILLKMSDRQPIIQKNGFELYKIDGRFIRDDIRINFELQIKSLVNVFWSEIDHRILYKNFNYVLTEDFYRDIMASIKDNLSMIDRQLMVVFDHLNDLDANEVKNEQSQIKEMLSKVMHDVYIGKVREELGFVIGFKKSTDIIVDYIFMREAHTTSRKYSENFIRVLNRIIEISGTQINFDNYIEFEREIFYNDDFTRKIGNAFIDVINKDFKWNLFFKIIFEIEEGNNAEDFEGFLVYLRYIYRNNLKKSLENKDMTEDEKDRVINSVLGSIADCFIKNMDIDFINQYNMKELNKYIEILLFEIDNYKDWEEKKEYIKSKVEDFKYKEC